MKKLFICFTLIFLFSSFFSFSQENEKKIKPDSVVAVEYKKHELKLGAVKLLFRILDLEYEFVFGKYSSAGANLIVNLSPDDNYLYNFSISPFFRMYFSKKEEYGTKGFFAQAFLPYYMGEEYGFRNNANKVGYSNFGFGVGAGSKWVNKKGFVLQIFFGVGRGFGSSYFSQFIVQGDMYLGYKFSK